MDQNRVASDRLITKPAVESNSCRQLDIFDPDEECKHDPFMVTEYIQDIFKYMRTMEDKYPIRKDFLNGRGTTPKMRQMVIDWLVGVCLNFNMRIETLHICVSIIDRYIQDNEAVRNISQLVGISALFIAAKYEEIYYPCLYDLKFTCSYIYSDRKILQTERDVLRKLDFCLGRPVSIHFLRRYGHIAKVNNTHHVLAKYMLELALMEYDMTHVKPSLQAAAACCLSIGILNGISDLSSIWNPTLIHYTGYESTDFEEVINCLANILMTSDTSGFQTIRRKYAGSEYEQISLNSLLKGSLVMRLAGMASNQ